MNQESRHANDIFKDFRVQSVSEFFRKNAAMLGYTGKIRSLTTLIHEGVTNALDACEDARILPDIRVEIEELGSEHYRVAIEDNASGIPLNYIPEVFGRMLAGSKAHRNIQSRGQQGIGISGAVMYSQVTTGKPSVVITSTGDSHVVKCEVQIDVEHNIGRIVHKKKRKNDEKWRGTKLLVEAKKVLYNKSRYSPYNYLRMTSISNPHANITFVEPDGSKLLFERSITTVPTSPKEIKPHPQGISPHDMLLMARYTDKRTASSFLLNDFVRISKTRLGDIEKLISFSLGKNPSKLTWKEAEELVQAFSQVKFMAPPTEGLIPIGDENVRKGLETTINPEFVYATTRSAVTYKGGIPFIVEVGVAYGGNHNSTNGIDIIRYANSAPLIFDQGGCAITEAVNSIDWRRYGVKEEDKTPLTLFINLVSTHIPYTSAGKQAIAMEEEIYSEIRNGIMDVGRSLKSFLRGKRRAHEKRKKRDTLRKYAPETARALSMLIKKKESSPVEEKLYAVIAKKYGEQAG
ncbi:MAG: DNA topoisomerase VI subunit B [Theionarchaea archaeon]|nr:DNA topoisomerase VI subunit B [Theionarchaea archaeon]MBU7000836.1 DNA topoisomerase VI subunit B [Theionarchaea archaeon]MBU7021623.1 DNA topoisomerase VI subunit B [Theionarchaea archaeon]MBU7034914.1 DNA topoisomerase VI subunit B [Theionarchaea archaeon]MBU7039390.1 DNA topoisomerase VI subunit B [Theionarchaea archaeon]